MIKYIHKSFFIFLFFLCISKISAQEEYKLLPEQIDAFKKQAITSVTELSRYISIIADKRKETTSRNNAIELAISLFASENNVVQVSSIKGMTKSVKIRNYFNKIKVLPYSSVKITWYDIYLSSDFIQGTDGKYYGTATIFQKFEGTYNKEMGTYRDITKKNISLVVEKVKYVDGLNEKERWVLKLGDINVEETRDE